MSSGSQISQFRLVIKNIIDSIVLTTASQDVDVHAILVRTLPRFGRLVLRSPSLEHVS